jgi:hypothetical protein
MCQPERSRRRERRIAATGEAALAVGFTSQ